MAAPEYVAHKRRRCGVLANVEVEICDGERTNTQGVVSVGSEKLRARSSAQQKGSESVDLSGRDRGAEMPSEARSRE